MLLPRQLVYAILLLAAVPCLARAQSPRQGEPSAHTQGPRGLEAWTVTYPNPDGDSAEWAPQALVIARHGHVLRRIQGESFIFAWKFSHDGRRIAVETGPLHFGLTCYQTDLASGRKVARYDCYRAPQPQPAWVTALLGG